MGNSMARTIFCSYLLSFPVKVARDHAHSIVVRVEIPGPRPLVTPLHIASLIPLSLRQLHWSWSTQNFAKLSASLKGGRRNLLNLNSIFSLRLIIWVKKMVNVFECPSIIQQAIATVMCISQYDYLVVCLQILGPSVEHSSACVEDLH